MINYKSRQTPLKAAQMLQMIISIGTNKKNNAKALKKNRRVETLDFYFSLHKPFLF